MFEDLSFAFRYLANYYLKTGNLDDAYAAAHKCTQFNEVSTGSYVINGANTGFNSVINHNLFGLRTLFLTTTIVKYEVKEKLLSKYFKSLDVFPVHLSVEFRTSYVKKEEAIEEKCFTVIHPCALCFQFNHKTSLILTC